MNKRKICSYIAVSFLMAFTVLGGTVAAYMITQTRYKENLFTPAQVSCVVNEVTDASMTQKESITIHNTSNIDAYLRICFVSYWIQIKDGNAEVVGKASLMPAFEYDTTNWIQGDNNTYYYKSPVSPDTSTEELLNSNIVLGEEDGYKQVVEVFAEAIQSLPASAVTSSWNVTLDASGNISSAP